MGWGGGGGANTKKKTKRGGLPGTRPLSDDPSGIREYTSRCAGGIPPVALASADRRRDSEPRPTA
jgi:hypothetical protein